MMMNEMKIEKYIILKIFSNSPLPPQHFVTNEYAMSLKKREGLKKLIDF